MRQRWLWKQSVRAVALAIFLGAGSGAPAAEESAAVANGPSQLTIDQQAAPSGVPSGRICVRRLYASKQLNRRTAGKVICSSPPAAAPGK